MGEENSDNDLEHSRQRAKSADLRDSHTKCVTLINEIFETRTVSERLRKRFSRFIRGERLDRPASCALGPTDICGR